MNSNVLSTRRWAAMTVATGWLFLPFACTVSPDSENENETEPAEESNSEAADPIVLAGEMCGDGYCDQDGDGETCLNCQWDCGPCPACGDNWCNGSETCFSCSHDCCPPCGDGLCTGSENSATCLADCGKYYLDLLSITSIRRDDAAGKDEPRLYVSEVKVWSNDNFGTGDSAGLSHLSDKLFMDNITVRLNEYDGFPENQNKILGSFTVYRATATINQETEYEITNNDCGAFGYCYRIRYKVLLQ